MRATTLFALGIGLVIFGTAILVVGSLGSARTSTGLVVFIGPVPIVFGSGTNGGVLVLIAFVAAVGMILLFYLPIFMRRRPRGDSQAQAIDSHEIMHK
jgi:uncharacterized membrane protein